jgi:hypothetical protein
MSYRKIKCDLAIELHVEIHNFIVTSFSSRIFYIVSSLTLFNFSNSKLILSGFPYEFCCNLALFVFSLPIRHGT